MAEKITLIKVCEVDVPGWWDRDKRIYSPDGISPTITTGGNAIGKANKIIVEDNIKKQNFEASYIPSNKLSSEKSIGEWQGYRIRKLTPRECFRLQGVSDEDIDSILAHGKISESLQYHLAGDSICVDVMEKGIFKNLI